MGLVNATIFILNFVILLSSDYFQIVLKAKIRKREEHINSAMRYIFSLTIFTFLLSQCLLRQVLDVAPTGKQNVLPVEGGGVRMKIDSITPLNKSIDRLNDNWSFLEKPGRLY